MLSSLLKQSPPLPFTYTLTRSKRKTIAVYVRNQEVEVRAPLRAPNYFIIDFLHQKSAWILKQLAAKQPSHSPLAPQQIIHYLGKSYQVEFVDDLLTSINIEKDRLIFRGCDFSEATLKNQFLNWLGEQAQHYIPLRARTAATQLQVIHKLRQFRFKITRSTWGHCSARGIIQFNPLIMLTPPTVVDYLIAHEVSHLVHMNHSAAFWQTVAQLCPDYTTARKTLRGIESSLTLFH